jgi:hypothetical protein
MYSFAFQYVLRILDLKQLHVADITIYYSSAVQSQIHAVLDDSTGTVSKMLWPLN